MSFELRAAVRAMLLPVVSSREDEFLAEVDKQLAHHGNAEDKASWIRLQLRRWQRDQKPSPEFKKFVSELLYLTGRDPVTFMFENTEGPNGESYAEGAKKAATGFFDLHKSLVAKHLFTHDEARQILSHMGMIARLAIEERMTASEISRIITVRDNRFSLNWRTVKAILQKINCEPKLEVADFERIFEEDKAAEPQLLGDLDLPGSIERISEIATTLGCTGDFSRWLTDIFITQMHAPYLTLLHYQLTIQAEYDHAVTYAYEFNPRGSKGVWMTEKYLNAAIPVGKSAVLNNSKATLRFDQVWVSGRDDNLRPAAAMASILQAIENLGAQAKQELAAQIRGLLHRYLRINAEAHAGGLPFEIEVLDSAKAAKLLARIGKTNTGTSGILEQRLVDCYGMKQHPKWSARGLGDSVFAASTFRKKLGDVEFELPLRPHPTIVSYESHGGNLSEPYVFDHLDTFGKVLHSRQEELEAIAPLPDWQFKVIFVAHSFELNLPTNGKVNGCNVTLEYLSFESIAETLSTAKDSELVNMHLIAPLNTPYVHPDVRRMVSGILA